MPSVYDRSDAEEFREIDRWDGGVGWLAHPDEAARRASHAVHTDEGYWLFDPLDAPGLDALFDDDVAGVAVLSDYHARDADVLARRYDVPVTVPAWLSRVPERVDAPVERVEGEIADFSLRPVRPMYAWRECVAYRERDETLYVADFLSSHDAFVLESERVALPTISRLSPPFESFGDLDPERIVFGHGAGVFEDASAALADSLSGARRRFPRALVSNVPGELRAMLGALRG